MRAEKMFDLTGQVAFVTGAASGIGLAYAEVLAEHGARVTLADIDRQRLDEQTARLKGEGFEVRPELVDVTDAEALRAAIDRTAAAGGRLDIAFANAGIGGGAGLLQPGGGIDEFPWGDFSRILDINLHGVFRTIAFAAPHMKKNRYGRIVVTASIAGLEVESTSLGYGVSKAGAAFLTKLAARQLAADGICVNAIAPGAFWTNIAGGRLYTQPEVVARFESISPMNRMAKTEEMKGLALLLASPAASYITGAVVPIDGGTLLMRIAR